MGVQRYVMVPREASTVETVIVVGGLVLVYSSSVGNWCLT